MIKPTVVVALVLFGTSHLAEAQYDARDLDVIDLLNPQDGAASRKRRCTVEIDKANIPCNDAWYVQFKDGSRAIQFNRASEASPVVSLFGTESVDVKGNERFARVRRASFEELVEQPFPGRGVHARRPGQDAIEIKQDSVVVPWGERTRRSRGARG